MRLTEQQRLQIRDAAARLLGEQAEVWLFGSRVDDTARGGDIDLYVEFDGEAARSPRAAIAIFGEPAA